VNISLLCFINFIFYRFLLKYWEDLGREEERKRERERYVCHYCTKNPTFTKRKGVIIQKAAGHNEQDTV
jgi:hypothetical protein